MEFGVHQFSKIAHSVEKAKSDIAVRVLSMIEESPVLRVKYPLVKKDFKPNRFFQALIPQKVGEIRPEKIDF